MNWNQFFKIEDLHRVRGLSTGNKVTIEFEVKLFPHSPKSILIKPTVHENTSPSKAPTTTAGTARSSTSGNSSNSNNNGSTSLQLKQVQSKSSSDNDIQIIETKPKVVTKLEAMHLKLTTDLRSVLLSQDKADVKFIAKNGEIVKGHGLILAGELD